MNSEALWYLTRGSGVITLLLLSAAVILGLTTTTRWSSPRWPRFVIENLHRNVSLLSVIFLVIHIASSVLDTYVSLNWLNAILPFNASYKPFWLGLGALSLDVFIAVAVTSLVRVRLGYRIWRGVHWAAYGCWGLAIGHGLGIGSDRHQAWFLGLNIVAIAGVAAALAWRTATALRPPRLTAAVAESRPEPAATQGALR